MFRKRERRPNLAARVIMDKSPFRYYGPDLQHMADSLEQAFCGRLGRCHVLAVNGGSSALYLAFGALGVEPGGEVLMPDSTNSATST